MLKLILTVVQVIVCVLLVAIVMLQSGKSAGLSGAIAGGMDTFLSNNKANSLEKKKKKMTKWVAILFMLLTLALYLI